MNKILITGAAGFIGFHLANRFLKENWDVTGLDNLNDYYDVNLKYGRLELLKKFPAFQFHKLDLVDEKGIMKLFEQKGPFDFVVNLAAQAGVRYSIQNPKAYTQSNIDGFLNILEACRHHPVSHLVYASSSSVYGGNRKLPFSTSDSVDHPLSLYATTKKANELMAHTYSSLYNIPTTGLRFFTVYGPWGRPDMALFLFTKAILEGKPIDVFNYGNMKRDFTYVDDIIEGIFRLVPHIPKPRKNDDSLDMTDPSISFAPYRVFNIGNNNPVDLMHFIEVLESNLGKKAEKNYLPLQDGDVPATFADVDPLMKEVGFKPSTSVEEGIRAFVEWYTAYYDI